MKEEQLTFNNWNRMENELLQTLDILKKFNEHLGSKILSKGEISEEKSNINDFSKLIERLTKLLQDLQENFNKDNEQTFEKLVSLSNRYSDFIWHFGQIQELINKIIRNYPL